MKEIVIISGKGGTGKTSITASFAVLGGNAVITADCDVDASDMHVFMQPQPYYTEDFYSGQYASIDQDLCINCGKCLDVCRFDAVRVISGRYSIDKMDCEGCGYCTRICPAHAIRNINDHVGWWYISKIKTSSKMVHARMKAGAENSGKLVAKVKNTAREIAETEENRSRPAASDQREFLPEMALKACDPGCSSRPAEAAFPGQAIHPAAAGTESAGAQRLDKSFGTFLQHAGPVKLQIRRIEGFHLCFR